MAALLRDRVPLFIDVQTTGTQADRSHLLEIGWAVGTNGVISYRLIRPPDGITIPGRVRQMTGITKSDVEHGIAEADAWRELNATVRESRPGLLVAHYARFELGFLAKLDSQVRSWQSSDGRPHVARA